jgi:hypothetical protein
MLKLQTKALAFIAVAGLVCTASDRAQAQSQTLTSNVTAIVQNSFTLAQTNAINFGRVVAVADTLGVNVASLTIPSNSAVPTPTNSVPARFVIVDSTNASNGVFAVSGAAPSTALNVSTGTLVNLTCGACPGLPPALTLFSVTPGGPTVTTSGAGAATINVGAVIRTVAGGNQYTDGTYTGSFVLTVSY